MIAAPCPAAHHLPETAAPANIFATPLASSNVAWPTEVSVWLDRSDRIVHVSSAWEEFAAPMHRREDILARPIGWFVADANMRECFRALFGRVRQEHRSVRMFTRCDQPGQPRAMRLSLIPLSAGAIEVTWSFLDHAATSQISPVTRHRFQQGELLRMCGWCHDVNLHATWQRLEDAAPELGLLDRGSLPSITHGICPACCGAVASEKKVASSSAAQRVLPVAV